MDYYMVNIDHVLDALQTEWSANNGYANNPTAFTKRRVGDSNVNMCCPFHCESRPSFGISKVYPYPYNCFSCGKKGQLIDLIAFVFKINYMEAYRRLLQDFSVVDFEFSKDSAEREWVGVTEEEIFEYRKKRHSYLRTRGISDYTQSKYEIGYDTEKSAITFPVRDLHGNPSFIVRRSVFAKFYNIPINAPKKKTLYGLNYLVGKTDIVYIVEGLIDVLACYEAKIPAVALMGRTLSDEQVKLLMQGRIKKVVLFLDNDEWGIKGTFEALDKLNKTPLVVSVAKYPDDTNCKDPNDLLLMDLLQRIEIVPSIQYMLKCGGLC